MLILGGDGSEGYKDNDGIISRKKRILWLLIPMLVVKYNEAREEKRGDKGGQGGDAGIGGSGGIGGFGGKKLIIELSKGRNYSETGSNGIKGVNGQSGAPGLGGLNGATAFKIVKTKKDGYGSVPGSEKIVYSGSEPSTERGPSGLVKSDLVDGGNLPIESIIQYFEEETKYLQYLFNNSLKLVNSRLLEREFPKNIINEPFIKPEISSLIERVQIFNQIKFVALLEAVENETIDFYNNENPSSEEKMMLSFLKASIKSTLMRHHSSQYSVLVVNVKNFLEITINQINNWKSLVKESIRDVYKKSYEDNLKRKIDEAVAIIDRLQKDIEIQERQINENIVELLNEVSKLKKDVQSEHLQLLKKRDELKEALSTKSLLSGLKLASQCLSFFGPKAALFGAAAQIGISAATMASSPKKTLKFHSSGVPLAVLDGSINAFKAYMSKRANDDLKEIGNSVKILEIINGKTDYAGKKLEMRIQELPESVKKYELAFKYAEQLKKTNTDATLASQIDERINEAKKRYDDAKLRGAVNKLQDVSQKVNLAVELFNDISASQSEISELEEIIKGKENEYNKLHKLGNQIDQFQNIVLKDVQNELNMLTKGLNGSSVVTLDFNKMQVKNRLNELKLVIFSLTNALEGKSLLANTINRIENTIMTMIDIYAHIEDFIEKYEFASYIEAATRNEHSIGIPESYKSQVNSLRKTIFANIIVERYMQAVEAFKYWSFPFYCEFSREVGIIDTNLTPETDDVSINGYAQSLLKLLDKIKKHEVELMPRYDNHLQSYSFENDNPFFKWSSEEYPFELKRLLSGEKVILYADIDHARFDAIKFCTLNLTIETLNKDGNNSCNNQHLQSVLGNYYVELTHSGVSNYKLKANVYTINLNYKSEEKLLLRYQYGCTGTCTNSNESYQKLRINKPLLSPYTFWEIKIDPIKVENKIELFGKLGCLFENNQKIIVSLTGQGQYVSSTVRSITNNTSICKTKRSYSINDFCFKNDDFFKNIKS